MDQIPNVTLVGDSTNGNFSTMLIKQLPNNWQFTLSNEIVSTTEGKVYEKEGISPDIIVPLLPKEERERGIDGGIEKAIALF